MATPHVAGVAGLIKAEFPSLTSSEIKARLLATVSPISSLNGITVTGGRLNALAAVDSIPPDTLIDSGPANLTKNTTAVFTFHSTEPGSSFQCRLDGGGFSSCGSPKTYNGLADGIHTFEVQATDSTGNTDPVPASRQWTVDATAPTNVQVTAPASGQTMAGTFTLMGTADDNSGTIQKMEFYIDSSVSPVCIDNSPKVSGSTFQCNWNSAGKPDGPHNVIAKAYDAAGNVSSSGGMAFSLDNIVMTLLSPNGGDNWPIGSTQTIQWNLTGISGRVRIHISRDGGATWKRIARRALNDGVFFWKVTNSTTTQGRIRACSVKKPTVCDTSDANFTIQ